MAVEVLPADRLATVTGRPERFRACEGQRFRGARRSVVPGRAKVSGSGAREGQWFRGVRRPAVPGRAKVSGSGAREGQRPSKVGCCLARKDDTAVTWSLVAPVRVIKSAS